ncbi:MAG: diadenylate cyclase [Brevinematia bacterium]
MGRNIVKSSILKDDFEILLKEIFSIILKERIPNFSVDVISYEEAKYLFNLDSITGEVYKRNLRNNIYYFKNIINQEEILLVKIPLKEYKLYSFTSHDTVSFFEFCIKTILDISTSQNSIPEILLMDKEEIIRTISKNYIKDIFNWLYKENKIFENILLILTTLSNQTYEGNKSNGYIIFTDKYIDDLEITFSNPIPLNIKNIRTIKKIIQISSKKSLCLVAFGNNIIGLKSLKNFHSKNILISIDKDFWEILVYSPQLSIDKEFLTQIKGNNFLPLIIFRNGLPEIPKIKLDLNNIKKAIKETFPKISPISVKKILKIFSEISKIPHGLIIIITTKELAESETKRLLYKSFQISPFNLFNKKLTLKINLIDSITSIDGAIIIDTDGICYGIGVILDGDVSSVENPSRGARYNSCLRYIETRNNKSIAIVASDDGMIDVVSFEKIQENKVLELLDSLISENIIVL